MDFCLCVLYAFLNSWTECDEIWYKNILEKFGTEIFRPMGRR